MRGMQRVSVVGISGSGKSTLARALAASLDATHVELDSIYHQPNWTPIGREDFRARVREEVAHDRWVLDGNYSSNVRDVIWSAADTVVWLDLPRRKIFPRLMSRTLRRMWTKEELWNGNRERWVSLVDPRPRENVILWMLTEHRRQRRDTERAILEPQYQHLAVHRLRSPREVAMFRARHMTASK